MKKGSYLYWFRQKAIETIYFILSWHRPRSIWWTQRFFERTFMRNCETGIYSYASNGGRISGLPSAAKWSSKFARFHQSPKAKWLVGINPWCSFCFFAAECKHNFHIKYVAKVQNIFNDGIFQKIKTRELHSLKCRNSIHISPCIWKPVLSKFESESLLRIKADWRWENWSR